MPIVIPSQIEGFRLGQLLENKVKIQAGFRKRESLMVSLPLTTSYSWNLGVKTERPRFIIIGLQTGRSNNQTANSALFDKIIIQI